MLGVRIPPALPLFIDRRNHGEKQRQTRRLRRRGNEAEGERQVRLQTREGRRVPRGKVQELREFFEASWKEMQKVTFPTRKETVATSIAVLVMVVFMSIFLGIVDFGLAKAIEAILS